MTNAARTWEEFFENVIAPGVPARYALKGHPIVWISLQGGWLSLSTPIQALDSVEASPLRQIRLRVVQSTGGDELEISTNRSELFREFFFLALGIADLIQVEGKDPYLAFADALATWKLLLQAAGRLSPEQEIGLMGELWTLLRLLRESGPGALDSWTGPAGETHDFRKANVELEVKSTRSADRVHVIHGLAQMVPSDLCSLFLLSLQWERAGSASGWDLPGLIAEVSACLGGKPLVRFQQILEDKFHFAPADAGLYTERFRLRTLPRLIKVSEDVPRLTKAMVDASLVGRISNVSYSINVDGFGVEDGTVDFLKVLP